MKEVIKNKLLIIFLIFFIILFTICSSVSASSSTVFLSDDTTVTVDFSTLENLQDNYIILNVDGFGLSMISWSSSTTLTSPYGGYFSGNFYCFTYDTNINNFVFEIYTTSRTYGGAILGYYTTTDIYNNVDEVVFLKAPQIQVEPMKTYQVEEIPLMIMKVMWIILPIFLLIFGTLLVLYLIKSKNLLHL